MAYGLDRSVVVCPRLSYPRFYHQDPARTFDPDRACDLIDGGYSKG